jgi:hypothetical protein
MAGRESGQKDESCKCGEDTFLLCVICHSQFSPLCLSDLSYHCHCSFSVAHLFTRRGSMSIFGVMDILSFLYYYYYLYLVEIILVMAAIRLLRTLSCKLENVLTVSQLAIIRDY